MNISHSPGDSNRATLFAIQGTNQSKYLQPDYFLASSNNSFLGKKYNKVQQRISRIVSAALLSGLVLTTSVDASASPNTKVQVLPYMQDHVTQGHLIAEPMMPPPPLPSFAAPPPPPPPPAFGLEMKSNIANASGKSEGRSALLSSIKNFSKQVLKKVKKEPKHKVVSSDGDLMSQLHNTLERRRSGIAGEKKDAKPRKVVQQAAKLTEEEIARKKAENLAKAAMIREANKKKWEETARQNEEIARKRREDEAAAVKARIEERRRERGEVTDSVINGVDPTFHHNIVTELRSEIASLREQLKNQGSSNLAGTLSGGAEDPIYSKPLDAISIASNSTQYAEPWQDSDALIGEALENEFGTSNTRKPIEPSSAPLPAFSSLEDLNNTASNTLSEEEKKALEILDEVLDDSSGYSSGCSRASRSLSDWSDASSLSSNDGYDTVYTSQSEYSDTDSEYPNSDSEYDLSSEQVSFNEFEVIEEGGNLNITAETQENASVTIDVSNSLQVSEFRVNIADEPEVSESANPADHNTLLAVAETELATSDTENELAISDTANDLDNTDLGIALDVESDNADISGSIGEQHVISPNTTHTTSLDQETLLKKAEALSNMSHDELRVARKVASNHIKQRMFERNMLVAVAAGDESEADQSQILGYSVWSSGAFGSAKQKTSNNSNGYSSKILGGSIGADVNFENDLLVGTSFSKIRSNIKHVNQSAAKNLNTYIASIYGTSPIKENLTLGVIGSAGFSPKPRSKLLSLESHLNYQIVLPQEIKLIPNIGFKYEYERSKTYQEQIDSNVSVAHAKKSYQALSTEIGSRVIFAPIKFTDSKISTMSITPTAYFSVERRIGSRGASNPLTVTYQELGQTIWAGSLPANAKTAKTSLNTGIGLIASHKNIKLELLYDHTRQKRFKAHQGMLKLKVNL